MEQVGIQDFKDNESHFTSVS